MAGSRKTGITKCVDVLGAFVVERDKNILQRSSDGLITIFGKGIGKQKVSKALLVGMVR